jgi:hypothetical protein
MDAHIDSELAEFEAEFSAVDERCGNLELRANKLEKSAGIQPAKKAKAKA